MKKDRRLLSSASWQDRIGDTTAKTDTARLPLRFCSANMRRLFSRFQKAPAYGCAASEALSKRAMP